MPPLHSLQRTGGPEPLKTTPEAFRDVLTVFVKTIVAMVCWLYCSVSVPAWSAIYTWVDHKGTVHFSDDVSSIPSGTQEQVKIIDESSLVEPVPLNPGVPFPASSQSDRSVNRADDKYVKETSGFRALERELIDRWDRMRAALRERRIEEALTYFLASSRVSFRSQFRAMRKDLPALADDLGYMRLIRVTNEAFAECDLRKVNKGKAHSLMLQFVLDADGVWRIRTF